MKTFMVGFLAVLILFMFSISSFAAVKTTVVSVAKPVVKIVVIPTPKPVVVTKPVVVVTPPKTMAPLRTFPKMLNCRFDTLGERDPLCDEL